MTSTKPGKKDNVFNYLKQRILKLDLAPGSALDEVLLSGQHSISRTPLREVFQRLAGEGYLVLENHRGASVSPMDLETMRHFFQSAPMIYAAIARLAAENASPAQQRQLKSVQRKFAVAVKSEHADDMTVHNHQFHETIGEMAASPYLLPSLRRLLIDHTRMSHRFYRTRTASSRVRVAKASEQHESMIEAIEQRQSAVAVALTLDHWALSRSEIDKYVLPDALPLDIPGESKAVSQRPKKEDRSGVLRPSC